VVQLSGVTEFTSNSKISAFFSRFSGQFCFPASTNHGHYRRKYCHGSPTADVTPLLLVLDAQIILMAKSKMRHIPLRDFFTGYKQFNLKKNEIIGGVQITKNAETGYKTFYKKVGSRKALTIAKVALAGLKNSEEYKLAVGSLNEYPRRLSKIEEYLASTNTPESVKLEELLKQEITPISDMRSDKDYRFQVCLNLLLEFIQI
ncbi:MAG TPA: hypothetical protein DHM37_07635, partial [Candidatus Cloacimonas sp.]|nr:hypothetical protein [Candidatus Cloacimonas sp.]